MLTIIRSSTCYTPVGFDQTIIYLMHEIERIFTKYLFWATVRSSLTYLDQGVRQDATAFVALCAWWSCRPSTRVQIPAGSICSIRSGQIYCESCRLGGPIRFGAATSPTFQWRKVSWIWLQSWIGQRAKCCPGRCQTCWTPAFSLKHRKTPSPNMASWRSWMRIKAANTWAQVGSRFWPRPISNFYGWTRSLSRQHLHRTASLRPRLGVGAQKFGVCYISSPSLKFPIKLLPRNFIFAAP